MTDIKKPAALFAFASNDRRDLEKAKETRAAAAFRSIASVIDTSLPAGSQVRTTQSVLDPLTMVGVAELRGEVHAAQIAGTPRYTCSECGEPVFIAKRPAAPGVTRDGRATFFKHYSSAGALECSRRSMANLKDAGAMQYGGQQEGLDHETLKFALADCLRHDPRFTEVKIEKYLVGADDTHCVPDVQALFEGKPVAFDLQLAKLAIATIHQRATFYAANGVHHVVLTDAVDLSRLSQQSFCDLHLNQAARIFAIDDASIAASIRHKQFQLKELRLVPQVVVGRPIYNIWEAKLVGTETILMPPGQRRIEGLSAYRQALTAGANMAFGAHRQAIRRAAAAGANVATIQNEWHHISRIIGGSNVDAAIADGLGTVMAFLAQAEIFLTQTPGQAAAAQLGLQQTLGTLLSSRHALHWAPLVVQVFKGWPSVEDAVSPANRAHLHMLLTHVGIVRPLMRFHAGMLAVLFTWLGYRLLVKAPKFQPNLRLSAGRA